MWFYCTDKVYHCQRNLKLVFLYALMEYIAMVNEMLLMMSGDIEPNPGPSEYFYCRLFRGVRSSLAGGVAIGHNVRGHTQMIFQRL